MPTPATHLVTTSTRDIAEMISDAATILSYTLPETLSDEQCAALDALTTAMVTLANCTELHIHTPVPSDLVAA